MLELHQRNKGFTWRPVKGPFEIVSENQAQQYNQQGFFLLERAFTPDELAPAIAEIDRFEAEGEALLMQYKDGRLFAARAGEITFTTQLVSKSHILKNFARQTVFASLCRDLIGPGARLYWDQAVYKKPGNPREFPWHQDNGYTYVDPQQYLTCWVALTDATVEHGCPWVVPGIHKLGTLKHEATDLGLECLRAPQGAVPVQAKAGDIVVFSSLTPHRTGPNLTKNVRKAYILQYAPQGIVAYRHNTDMPMPQDNPDTQFPVC